MALVPQVLIQIVDKNGGAKTQTYYGTDISIGRINSDVIVADPKVSQAHVVLTVTENNSLLVKDQGSRNGTHFRGERVSSVEIPVGSKIQIGDSLIHILHISAEKSFVS